MHSSSEEVKMVDGGIQVGDPEVKHKSVTDTLLHPVVVAAPGDPQEMQLDEDVAVVYRSYRVRWLVLFVTALLNNSNAMGWIMFAPVANFVDEFYQHEGAANWLSLVFMIAVIPVAMGAMWSASKYGLRSSILTAAWFNGLGATIRLLSHLPIIPESSRFLVVMLGQTIAAIAYPFIMFLPTKVAGAWFPNNQRSLATTIVAMANPLGVLLANLLAPQLVMSQHDIIYINAITFIPSIMGTILATVAIRTSNPPSAPTKSAHSDKMPYLLGLKKCLSSRAYLLLLLGLGGGMGMFNTLYTVMQQLLCPVGYSNSFSGICPTLMILGGTIGAIVSGIFVDKTKRYEETVKASFAIAVVFGVILAQLTLRTNLAWAIAIVCFLFGFFGLAAYPVGLEIGAECTFPVSETTSTGLIVLSGQIQGILYVLLITQLGKPLPYNSPLNEIEVCSANPDGEISVEDLVKPKDMTLPMLVFSSVGALLAIIFVIFFRPKLRRLGVDNQIEMIDKKKVVDNNGHTDTEVGVQTVGPQHIDIELDHKIPV